MGEHHVISPGPTPSSPFLNSPSLSRISPFVTTGDPNPYPDQELATTTKTSGGGLIITTHPPFITSPAGPDDDVIIRKALNEVTKLEETHDAWLPITQSRKGNAYYAAFHTLSSGIGVQALLLPLALATLGWTWGIICLTLTFTWQLYTLYLLVQLHESTETGIRYSRYMHLATATFGDKMAKLVAAFPIIYLSGGTCMALIVIGGSTSELLYQTMFMCGSTHNPSPLTSVEWYLLFTCAAVVLSQLPNLNSIAGLSLVGAIAAVGYSTLIWLASVIKGRLPNVSYDPARPTTQIARAFDLLNALGIIAFAFRGHNLILEIQATMPSSEKHPSRVPMWRGVKFAYLIIAICLFPLAIAGYWAYGQRIRTEDGSMLTALYEFHGQDVARAVLGLISMLVILNAVSSFQIYGIPVFDDLESAYTKRFQKPCPWWLRALIRAAFGYLNFFVAVALPFLGSLGGLLGGIALPVTLVHPCFMWLKFKKPNKFSPTWCLNWALGLLGMTLSALLVAAGLYSVINARIQVTFFKP